MAMEMVQMAMEMGMGSQWGPDGGGVSEAWSAKYKKSIDCNNPKGFSQRAHCRGRKKVNEEKKDHEYSRLVPNSKLLRMLLPSSKNG